MSCCSLTFASLQMQFYEGSAVPRQFHGWAFAAEHGSWNRDPRGGYEVIAVPVENGKATGEFEDFLTGFVLPDGKVWGRPVGIAVAKDGSLLVSDDGSNTIWRVTYTGGKGRRRPIDRLNRSHTVARAEDADSFESAITDRVCGLCSCAWPLDPALFFKSIAGAPALEYHAARHRSRLLP